MIDVYARFTFLARAAHGAATEDSEDRRRQQARERVQRHRGQLTAQQWDERRQNRPCVLAPERLTSLVGP